MKPIPILCVSFRLFLAPEPSARTNVLLVLFSIKEVIVISSQALDSAGSVCYPANSIRTHGRLVDAYTVFGV